MRKRDVIIKDTHRGLFYENGRLVEVLEAGRYRLPRPSVLLRRPVREIVLVDMRERELTIKGQEILTADKVAVRVSILVQFRVVDPQSALHNVASYEDRIYSDVQLAARRSLASMSLEEILTHRNKLSQEILADMKEAAGGYGVAVIRAAVKDLVFPGNLQEIMNRVLAAERRTEAELIEARAQAERARLEAQTRAETQRTVAVANAEARRKLAESEADAERIRVAAEVEALEQHQATAEIYARHPALLRLRELEAIEALGHSANARIYIGFDKHMADHEGDA